MKFDPIIDTIPTPVETINVLTAGGLRQATLIEAWGNPRSGKTTFCYQTAAMFLEKYNKKAEVLIIDSENSFDELRMEHTFGIKPGTFVECDEKGKETGRELVDGGDSRVTVAPGVTIEQASSMIRSLALEKSKKGKFVYVVWDSITSSQPEAEYLAAQKAAKEGGATNQYTAGQMIRPRILKLELNSIQKSIYRQPVTVLLINQATTKIMQWGAMESSGGGYGKDHAIQFKIRFNFDKPIEGNLLGINKGTLSTVSIEKSKFCPRVKDINIVIHDDVGGLIITDAEVIGQGVKIGFFDQSGAWYKVSEEAKQHVSEELSNKTWQGINAVYEDAKELVPHIKKHMIAKVRASNFLVDKAYEKVEAASKGKVRKKNVK